MNFDLICYITFSVILTLNEKMYGLMSTFSPLIFPSILHGKSIPANSHALGVSLTPAG